MTNTLATGSYVASSSTGSWSCSLFTTCLVKGQWNYFTSFNNTLCVQTEELPFYNQIGRYGFCTAPNGNVVTPEPIASIQGLAVATSIFLFVGSLAAVMSPASQGGKSPVVAAVASFVALCTSAAAFSTAASYEWYQDLTTAQKPTPMPFITSNNEIAIELVGTFWWGPAFWSTVIVFVITLLSIPTLCVFGRTMEYGDDYLDGLYGSGGDYKDAPRDDYMAQT